jgi:hypothetical protein
VFAQFEVLTKFAGSPAGPFTQSPTTLSAATTPPLVCQKVSEFWIAVTPPNSWTWFAANWAS